MTKAYIQVAKSMFKTGFDSMALEKDFVSLDTFLDETHQTDAVKGKPVVMKALVGASASFFSSKVKQCKKML
jgi:hypothetical protein